MTHTPIDVCLAGCGSIAATWVKTPAFLESVRLVALVDRTVDRAKRFGRDHGFEAVHCDDDVARAVRVSGARAVFDCTIPEAHPAVTIAALEAGCDVLGEKPMALDLADARRMVETARRTGRLYAVTQTQRWAPGMRRFRAFLESGVLGRLCEFHVDFYGDRKSVV